MPATIIIGAVFAALVLIMYSLYIAYNRETWTRSGGGIQLNWVGSD